MTATPTPTNTERSDIATPTERSDIATTGLIAAMPAAWQPYLQLSRLDRPIGWELLYFPCLWGMGLAWPGPVGWTYVLYAALFMIGAIAMRGAGCTFNDIVDRDIDMKVARTALRPIPSGRVSVRGAWIWLAAQALVGLAVLVQFNWLTIAVGAASLVLVAVYPFMKRITWWPQFFLGLAFSWGALVGWTAAAGSFDWPALVLYAGAIAWTIGYDTIYAHQDIQDDMLIGVKSTARLFGDDTKQWLVVFYVAGSVLWGIAGQLAGAAWPWFVGTGCATLLLGVQVWTVRLGDPKSCLRQFKANRWVGLTIFAGATAAVAIVWGFSFG